MGPDHPRVPGNQSPGSPVLLVEGYDAWGAGDVACGVDYMVTGQVIPLNLPAECPVLECLPLETGPGLGTT